MTVTDNDNAFTDRLEAVEDAARIYTESRSEVLRTEIPDPEVDLLRKALDDHIGTVVTDWELLGRPDNLRDRILELPGAARWLIEAHADPATTAAFNTHVEANPVTEQPTVTYQPASRNGYRPPGTDNRYVSRDAIKERLLATPALNDLPPLEAIVNNYLYRDTLAMLYGPSGCGKSFLTVSWALHVATGSWWEGQRVEAAPVLYIAAEGVRSMGKRVDAWTQHHGRDLADAEPVHWHPGAVNLFERPQAEALAEVAAELKVGLVIVDTLARCSVGADENTGRDMGPFVDNCDLIRTTSGACVLLVHHTGKDADKGGRGFSGLRAAMDSEVELGATGSLKVTKAKDWAEPPSLHLEITPVADSCVLIAGNDSEPKHTEAVLEALTASLVPGGVSASVWLKACDGVSERSFYRTRAWLLAAGQVTNIGTEKQPKYLPS